jgi:chromosomal replication initiator protein
MPAAEEGRIAKVEDVALSRFLRGNAEFASREELWQAVQQSIRERLGQERFSVWFRQTELMEADEGRLVVGVPNVIIQQFLSARYADAVAAAAADLVGQSVDVSFDVAPRLFRQMRQRRRAEQAEERGEPDRVVRLGPLRARAAVPDGWGFDHLIACRANRLPFAAARELAGQQNPRVRLVYVCGDYGVGKTALLRAVYALARGEERGLDPILTTAESWGNDYYRAIQRRTTHVFRERCRSCNLLVMDDVQFLRGKPGGQRELVHTVKHILGKGGRVALSGLPHPRRFEDVIPDLKALLEKAFPAVLLPPEEDERLEVVAQLAARQGLKAADGVLALIARDYGSSFALMESAVTRLGLYAGVTGCGRVELSAARDAFAAMSPASDRPVTCERIREAVAEESGVTAQQLVGRSRRRTVCLARHVAIYLARRLTHASLSEVGGAFGGLSHSTVKHAADKIGALRAEDAELDDRLERLEQQLTGR